MKENLNVKIVSNKVAFLDAIGGPGKVRMSKDGKPITKDYQLSEEALQGTAERIAQVLAFEMACEAANYEAAFVSPVVCVNSVSVLFAGKDGK